MKNTTSLLRLIAIAGMTSAAAVTGAAASSNTAKEYEHREWSFSGPFGTYDKEALQRGFQVYETVCSNCHGLDLLSFRNLGQKGGPFYLEECPEGAPDNIDCSDPNQNPIVKSIAENYKFQVTDGPDEYGEMFQRPALPSDHFPNPWPNEQVARMANNNAYPPDLSLIAKARHGGADYIVSLLTGYEDPPATINVDFGQYYNPYFPGDLSQALKPEYLDEHGHAAEGVEVPEGGVLSMPPQLMDGIVDYADKDVPQTAEQYAKDVAHFLMWAAEPKMEARKSLGVITIIYMLILAGLLYWSYRQIWSNAHQDD